MMMSDVLFQMCANCYLWHGRISFPFVLSLESLGCASISDASAYLFRHHLAGFELNRQDSFDRRAEDVCPESQAEEGSIWLVVAAV